MSATEHRPRAAVYARVSREEQTKGHSLATQESDARRFAASRGIDVVSVHREEGVSGAARDRPALAGLIDECASGGVDVVLVRHVDRLARDAGLALDLSQRFAALGVSVIPFAESDRSTESDRFMYGIRALVAEQERSRTRERMMRGKAESARNGRWHGGEPPFGTRPEPAADGRGTVLVAEPSERDPLREVALAIAAGRMSVPDAASALNARGVVTRRGRRWDHRNLRLMLRNRRLTGVAEWWGELVEIPAVLSRREFARLQRALDESSARYRAKSGRRTYPLSGRIECGCGRHWIGAGRKDERWYRCSAHPSYAKGEPCDWSDRRWMKADRIEAAVLRVLHDEWLADPSVLRGVALDRLAADVAAPPDGELASARARVTDLEARYTRLLVDMAGSDIDRGVLRSATAQVGDDLALARERVSTLEASLPSPAGERWRAVRETVRGHRGPMSELAGLVAGLAPEIDALNLLPEVDALASEARALVAEGDLETLASRLDLRVRLTGRETFELKGIGDWFTSGDGRPGRS